MEFNKQAAMVKTKFDLFILSIGCALIVGSIFLLIVGPAGIQNLLSGHFISATSLNKIYRLDFILLLFSVGCTAIILTGTIFRYYLIFLLGVALLVLNSGAFGQDLISHLFKTHEIARGLEQGQFNLYISRNIYLGRGLPVFVYYLSWIYYPGIIISALGLSFFWGLKLTLVMLFSIMGWGIYRFLRYYGSRSKALMGMFIFSCSNYIVGIFVFRLALAECFAWSILPFAACYLDKALSSSNLYYVALASMLCSLMFICHPLSFINIVPTLLFMKLMGFGPRPSKLPYQKRLVLIGFISSTIILLTCFRWLPALLEKEYIYLHHHGLVRFYGEFLSAFSYLRPTYFMSPGIVQISCFILSLFWLGRKIKLGSKDYFNDYFLILIIGIYIFLTTKMSYPVWDKIDLLQANQFAWRLLAPLLFFLVLLFVRNAKISSRLFLVVSIVLLIQGLVLLASYHHNLDQEMGGAALDERIEDYSQRKEGWGIDEFMLRLNKLPAKPTHNIKGKIFPIEEVLMGKKQILKFSPVSENGIWELEKFWNVRYLFMVAGNKRDFYPTAEGLIAIFLRKGESQVEIIIGKPYYVVFSEITSAVVLMILLVVLIISRREKDDFQVAG